MVTEEIIITAFANLLVGATLWYKIGKIEGKLTQMCKRIDQAEDDIRIIRGDAYV